jgi:hypothetical protein
MGWLTLPETGLAARRSSQWGRLVRFPRRCEWELADSHSQKITGRQEGMNWNRKL